MPPAPSSPSPGAVVAPAPNLHPDCPVCNADRVALGHYAAEAIAPFDAEDLVLHLMTCSRQLPLFGDECEPF